MKHRLLAVALALTSASTFAQTKSITIGSLEYVGTGISGAGVPTSEFLLSLDASAVTATPVAFSNARLVVKGTDSDSGAITTGPGC